MRNDIALADLAEALEKSWARETSNDPNSWRPDNPAWGQCAVTALVVQDYFGGHLLNAKNAGVSHYWNRLDNGAVIDLTKIQFDVYEPTAIRLSDRTYMLSFPDTVRRYDDLSSAVERALKR